jgi:hypothetical protein
MRHFVDRFVLDGQHLLRGWREQFNRLPFRRMGNERLPGIGSGRSRVQNRAGPLRIAANHLNNHHHHHYDDDNTRPGSDGRTGRAQSIGSNCRQEASTGHAGQVAP